MPDQAASRSGGNACGAHRWPRRAALLAVLLAIGFLGVPALAGVPARLVEGCGDWIVAAVVLELVSAVGFVVFFKLIFAAPVSWRRGAPAGLRALGASTILPGGGLIGPGVGAWSASAEKPSLAQLARATVTFAVLSSAPAALTLAALGTVLWLGMPGGPHVAALTVLPASIAVVVVVGIWVLGRASRRQRLEPRRGGVLGALSNGAGAFGVGVADAQTLLAAGDWKLLGSVVYFAFDGAALWAAFHAYGHTPPIGVVGMGYLVGSLAGGLPLPAGLGAVDGGLIGALALYGAPVAPAAAAVLLYRGISLSLPLALGAVGWLWSPAPPAALDDGGRARSVRRAGEAPRGRGRARDRQGRIVTPVAGTQDRAAPGTQHRAAPGTPDRARTPATILLTGASGYVGGCLLRRFEHDGLRVRCLTRRPEVLRREAAAGTEVVLGDVLEPESLTAAMEGVEIAYYLVHSMGAPGSFADLDRRGASNFARAARAAGVRHIVYLSGLGSGDELSTHLASRHEVGHILRGSGIVTTELRASIVIGVGSASFETVRAIVERLPAIPAPNWVDTAAQPIAIDDVVEYLFAAQTGPPTRSAIFEIGGDDLVTYADVMREYARQRRLRRRVFSLPVITGRAWRLFLGLLIPNHGRVAGAMVDSLRNETVVSDPAAREAFAVRPSGLPEAIERALAGEDHDFADTTWGEELPAVAPPRWGGSSVRGRLVTSRVEYVHVSPREAFAPIQRIGGPTGWYGADWFWHLRGMLDELRGGEGMRRGRADPDQLHVGDTVDFWRVERIESGRRLLLAAEMKIPGRLWLQFEVEANGSRTGIRQTTVFDPAGYVGLAYWYALYPVHRTIFGAMLRGLHRVTVSR